MRYGLVVIQAQVPIILRVAIGKRLVTTAVKLSLRVRPTARIATAIGSIIPQVSTAEQKAVTTVIIPPMSMALTAKPPSMRDIAVHSISITAIAPPAPL